METEIKILEANSKDIEHIAQIAYQVAKLHDEALPQYFKPVSKDEQLKNIYDLFKDDRITVFKAVYEEEIRGFLFLEMIHRISKGLMFSKLGCILNFGVDENYRNHGIGTLLLHTAEQYVKDHDGEALDLSVFAFNQSAIKFYERLGYKTIDISMRKVLK